MYIYIFKHYFSKNSIKMRLCEILLKINELFLVLENSEFEEKQILTSCVTL